MMIVLSNMFGIDNVNNQIESKLKRLEERLKKYESRVEN
jgi:ribosome-associated translation inhibitor RaiA